MKKLFSLVLCVAMLFCFAACGSDSTDSTASDGEVQATYIKFSADTYEVKVGGYQKVSEGIAIEPAGAKVDYEISDEEFATIDKKGEVTGIKEGTVTVTAKSKDGKVTATVTVNVKGYGMVSSHNEDMTEGGITNKRKGSTEYPPDAGAIIVFIAKNVDKAIEKTIVTTLDYGARNEDGQYIQSGEGFYVVKNNDRGTYIVEDVPAGEYVGLIISSNATYANHKTYDNASIATRLKATALSQVLSDAEIDAIAGCTPIQSREFDVQEFVVKANEITVLAKAFAID